MLLGGVVLVSLLAAAPAMPAPPASASEIEITGRVLDARGKAAVKVPVALATAQRDAAPLAETVTDAEGRFRLIAPDVGMYEVRVAAPGMLPMNAPLHPLLVPVDLPPLRLEPSDPLRLRLVDGDRRPRVDARAIGWPNLPAKPVDGWSIAPRAAAADAEGSMVLPRRRGESLDVAVIASGLPEVQARRVPGAALDLRTEETCPRVLRIRDGAGAPVAGAIVSSERFVLGATDAAGELTVAAPCSHPFVVTAASSSGAARARIEPLPPGQTAALELTLEPPQRFAGRVID
ncbi:MAG: Carboxypeptidase regulatory-like domain, partial [Acidobacteriota bacterium]|nr:Carboxypeptidase regulatory-like domain [Acidobacteriota bacterium]